MIPRLATIGIESFLCHAALAMKLCKACSFQFTKETSDAHFCPNCGNAQFACPVFYEKTTSNYDPRSQHFKPWRDIARIPKRSYHSVNKKGNEPPRKPKPAWVPVGRQAIRPKPKLNRHLYESFIANLPNDLQDGSIDHYPQPSTSVVKQRGYTDAESLAGSEETLLQESCKNG